MPEIRSLEDLRRLKDQYVENRQARMAASHAQVVVGMGTCGIAAGAQEALRAILNTIEEEDLSGIVVSKTGCVGACEWEPRVEVSIGGGPKATYGKVSPKKARQIIKEHVMGSRVVQELVIPG
ncbi:MAG: (2Fe-2S) ferredoxin domain-containing protein [Ardenticatenia bacterium]|nr:(2Fe-2S) ferredoxin domain-containing protein [Ardenticatenia bacterium]